MTSTGAVPDLAAAGLITDQDFQAASDAYDPEGRHTVALRAALDAAAPGQRARWVADALDRAAAGLDRRWVAGSDTQPAGAECLQAADHLRRLAAEYRDGQR